MMKATRSMGLIFGILTAVLYGLIPTFFVPISAHSPYPGAGAGLSELSIVFYRFLWAAVAMGLLVVLKGESWKVPRTQWGALLWAAAMGAGSAFFLAAGYKYMSSGIATTLHFLYPALTAALMITFFGEKSHPKTWVAIVLAVAGVAVLHLQGDQTPAWMGIIVVVISAICFSLYLIGVQRGGLQTLPNFTLVFYIMAFGALFFGLYAGATTGIQPIEGSLQWGCLLGLGVVSTALPNIFLVGAVKYAGPTTTGVLGALEPLTAVVAGCLFLQETLSPATWFSLALILPSVVIIARSKPSTPVETSSPTTTSY